MDRREFIKYMAMLGVGSVIPNSFLSAKEIERILDNEDREGFYIRFIKPIKPVDPSKWTLKVGGLCDNPKIFTLSDIKKLAKDTQVSRMKCVESWSSKAKWGGFRPKTLFDAVKPKKQAKYLYFYSADDYYEYISLEDLLKSRVLFAYEMNDGPLPDIHGGPLRLLVPFKYGYKSVKTILKLDFVEKEGTGYWSHYGYSKDGTVQKGTDHALDLKTYKILMKEGEPEY
ncbi:MAG: molybdopterin-dependent oxidoreductase [Proteobacteria bacterium]|nr:molybdopterin-dependent oxidoreductase [Pseudomonadota bacterium]